MATMSMNKAIHGAVRRDLNRFLDALAAFRDGDKTRAAQLGTAWDNFDGELTRHHEGEHEIAWPALVQVGVTQQTIDQMDAEHEVMAERLAATRGAMSALRSAPTAANAQTARTAMGELKTVTEEHLDHEEREIEPVYLANHDDPVIKAMGKKFAKVSPKEGGEFFAWMLDGPQTDATATIKSQVPGPVLAILTKAFGRAYTKNVAPVWR
jgi:hemerythrin-like domain-containing protein